MVDPPVGYRFHPTDEEIVGDYVRPKNIESNTSRVDEVMNTVDIYEFDPWELPYKSRINSTDEVWYFFGCKKDQQNRGERQSRRTKSGFWKKTGVTMDIMRKRGNREKIGEKRVFVFQYSKILGGPSKPKSDWVMHEHVATFLSPDSPNQTMMMMKYTVCKVMFKGDERVLSSSSSSSAGQIQHHHLSLIPHVNSNNSGGLSSETEVVGHFTTISFCVLPFLMSLRLNYRIHVSLLAFLIWRKKLCSWMKFSGVSTTRQLMIGTVCSVMMRNRGILCLCRRIATITDLKCHLLVFSLVIAMMTVILIPYLQELQQAPLKLRALVLLLVAQIIPQTCQNLLPAQLLSQGR
ncbi:NAC domain-containing protein 5 [Brassica rapa]|uniref:NAC domain-containing protein 5 n=1 Tax=Brassica campestris TaxID=3711 RepID=UPI00142E8FDF|nr:NAC domain-containing protein 5 [Brassica rapa]